MKNIREWEYFSHLQHYTKLYKNFYVELFEKQTFQPKRDEKERVLETVLNPLARIAKSIALYGSYTDAQLRKIQQETYIKKRGKIVIKNNDLTPFMALIDKTRNSEERGSLLFEIPLQKELLASIFTQTYNPIVMAGTRSSCTTSAKKFAQSHSTDNTVFALLSEANIGLEWLFFFGTEKSLEVLTEIAAENSKTSEHFVANFGPEAKLAPLETHTQYGTGFCE